MPATIAELSARFPASHAAFAMRNNLIAIEISHPHATGAMFLHGAHVASWKPVQQMTDVLWLSEFSNYAGVKPIRGGVPICFPWFGPKADNKAAPAHGLVRTREWEIESLKDAPGGVTVVMVTRSMEEDAALFPSPFELRQKVTFGNSLTMTLEIKNTGNAQAVFEEALHTYFAVADVRDLGINGLSGAEYIDKVDGMKRKTQQGSIAIVGETDRPYLNTNATVTITDPGRGRMITIEKTGSNSTVVWNPWIAKAAAMPDFGNDEWPGMLCIETANIGENAVKLAPGASHSMTAKIRVGL